ncbi:hypothetical protein N7G274_005286 [Stereocaulon virgatum]|uniref:Indoleamine 2,3-dioxygenase n=1 Tax=Stereocaulon virgatum TaxID=373712 RepID=A0ABR4AFD0_9LECA
MGSLETPQTFPILTTIPKNDEDLAALAPFTVSIENGFLPLSPPPTTLPSNFSTLTSLLERMPIRTISGEPGLLAKFTLGEAVLIELPDLTDEIDKAKSDLRVIGALYRDYCFLASAYLLEPCHERFVKGEGYGLGRQRLPRVLARPLARVAEMCAPFPSRVVLAIHFSSRVFFFPPFNADNVIRSGFKPFMEYAGSYALFNYRMADPSLGMAYSNLRLIRAFEHGLDPTSSEAGFVLVHIDMVKHSGQLVKGAVNSLKACSTGDREAFNDGLEGVVKALVEVNAVMDGMWKKSKPNDYTSFRTFIFGITKQSMFPHGVVYEGVSEEAMSFRGESGANDSMIPLCDNLLEISMPDTPLTEILNDFRSYRPGNHRQFLEWVKDRAQDVGIRKYAMGDRASAVLYLHALNQVRDFRWRHWCFTREYILKKTSHPTATGGSPIILWLPNQLHAVYAQMTEVATAFDGLSECKDLLEVAATQRETLKKEVRKFLEEK